MVQIITGLVIARIVHSTSHSVLSLGLIDGAVARTGGLATQVVGAVTVTAATRQHRQQGTDVGLLHGRRQAYLICDTRHRRHDVMKPSPFHASERRSKDIRNECNML